MDDHGVVTAPGTLRMERLLPGPIERVWAYLTESEKRAQWLAGGPMDLAPAGKLELTFRHADLSPVKEPTPDRYKQHEAGQVITGMITRCEPPRLLSFTWALGGETEVTFELVPKDDDVLLILTHRRIGDRGTLVGVSGGWHTHLGILADRLNGRTPQPFWRMHELAQQDYAKRLADAPLAQSGTA
jgi:uncharacterized protein YndB with AHSA1/START domain